jgi:hypothetical protein
MSVTLNGSNGITFNDGSSQTAAASPYVLKNRIINGAMVIDQRNAGASFTPGDGIYSLDRWRCFQSVASKYSVQQNAASVTPPTGFTNYLGATSLSAYTPTGSDYFFLSQAIEGYNIADLGFGTANAKTITLSFWVRSSLTGSFGALVYNNSYSRTYPILYTISSANTWEYKTITIAGDTSGTWLTTNGLGIGVGFCLGAGSTSSAASGSWTSTGSIFGVTGQTQVVGTNGATFYITGVQLEVGSTATPFERRLYGQELTLCQRYYQVAKSSVNIAATSSAMNGIIPLFVPLRSDVVTVGKTSGNIAMGDMVSAGYSSSSTPTDSGYQNNSLSFNYNQAGFTGLTTYRTYRNEPNVTNPGIFTLSAEL